MGVGGVQVRYEPVRDVLTVQLQQDAAIADVSEDLSGTVFGFDRRGKLVVIQISDATRNIDQVRRLEQALEGVVTRILGRSATE
ncbi:MAG: hypothetical protein FWJ73_00140 [Limnochordales bacterium]